MVITRTDTPASTVEHHLRSLPPLWTDARQSAPRYREMARSLFLEGPTKLLRSFDSGREEAALGDHVTACQMVGSPLASSVTVFTVEPNARDLLEAVADNSPLFAQALSAESGNPPPRHGAGIGMQLRRYPDACRGCPARGTSGFVL